MSMCDNCKYHKIVFAPYIRQKISTCTYKSNHCALYYKDYYQKKKGEEHENRGNQGKNV